MNAKSFLYGLRALLCSKWIVECQTAPPVWFPILVERYLTGDLKSVLAQLLEEKKHGNEQGENKIDALIWDFSLQQMQDLSNADVCAIKEGDSECYDPVLRGVVMNLGC